MNELFEQINSAGLKFVEFALPMLVQSAVLILILLLVDFVLRKKLRAVFRYWIWLLVLLKLTLPTSLTSPFSLGYFVGDRLIYADKAAMPSEPQKMFPETSSVSIPACIDLSNIQSDRFTRSATPIIPDTKPMTESSISNVQQDYMEPAKASAPVTPLSWQGVLFLLWLVSVMVMLLLLLQRMFFIRCLLRQARPANNLMTDALEYCQDRMGVRRNIALKVSLNATSPAVCGLFRPVILLPQDLGPILGSSHLRTVIMHELAHIKRGDLWVNTIQVVLQIFYLYNPLLWLANAIIRRVREQAVDETVLVAMGPKAQQYPETLVNVARLAWQRPALSLRLIGVIESKSQLKERIRKMLERPAPKTAKLGIAGILIIIALGAFLLPMAEAQNSESNISEVNKKIQADKEAEIKMLQDKIKELEKYLKKLQKQVQQNKSQIMKKDSASVDKVDVVVAPKPLPKPVPQPHPVPKVVPVAPVAPVAPVIPAPPSLPKLPKLPKIAPPPIPKIPIEVAPGEIHITTPRIEPPKDIVQQIIKVQTEKDALKREISRLRKELDKRKELDNISDQEAEEFEQKIEALEQEHEMLDESAEELEDRMEDWGEQIQDKMEDWSRKFQEQMKHSFQLKHQEKLMQYDQQMKMYEQQMGDREKQMREHERQMQQFERQKEQFEHQHEAEFEKELGQFERQMKHFEQQMDQWAKQHGHQMEQWAQKFNKDMDVSVEGMEDMLDNVDVEVNVDENADAKTKTKDSTDRKKVVEVNVDENADAKADVIVDDSKDKEEKITFTKGPNIITTPLNPGRKIIVRNRIGSVNVINGQPGQCKCTITVKASAETVEQAREKAKPVKIEVDEDDKALNLVVVKTDNDEWDDINVDLDIQIPLGSDIDVTTDIGGIKMNNLEGKIRGVTNVGDIYVSNIQGNVKLTTNVGKVVYEVPEEISAEVKALTDVGTIKTELPLDVIRNFQKSQLSGVLGDGRNKVDLRTKVGNITIRKAKSPLPAEAPMIR